MEGNTDKRELDEIFGRVVKRINLEFGDVSKEPSSYSSLEIKLFQCNDCNVTSVSADNFFCSQKHPCNTKFKFKCESCQTCISSTEDLKDHMMKDHHEDSILFLTCDQEKLTTNQPSKTKGNMLDNIDITLAKAKKTLFQQKVKPHTIGFKNNGNSCYLNAPLQALLGLPMVVMDMLNIKLMLDILECREGLVISFWKLCLACTKGDGVQANLEMKEVKMVMEQLDKQFEGSQMQDASEFLCRFIDELSRALSNAQTKMPEANSNVDSLNTPLENMVKVNFLHKREEFYFCSDCKAQSSARHSDMAIWCDTISRSMKTRTRSVSLQQLLEQNFAVEKREKRCEDCGCETATTISRLVKLPRVLVIYLKRYKYNHQDAPDRKVKSVIDIPETVYLTSLVVHTVSLPNISLSRMEQELAPLENENKLVLRDNVGDERISEELTINQFQWVMGDTANNNNQEIGPLNPGKAEHRYQLASVVAHHGVGASSGHYVADVFRFDVPGWIRYNDTKVTNTDSTSVRTGTNTRNGYIFSYLYQPLWDAQCKSQ